MREREEELGPNSTGNLTMCRKLLATVGRDGIENLIFE